MFEEGLEDVVVSGHEHAAGIIVGIEPRFGLGPGVWNTEQMLAFLAQHFLAGVFIGDFVTVTALGTIKCNHDQAPFDYAHLTTAGYSKIAD